jgi:hypothetical protein
MEKFKIFLMVLWGCFFVFVLIQILLEIKYRLWIKSLKKTPPPEAMLNIIENLPQYKVLNTQQKHILHYKITRFCSEKQFFGIKLNITDEIKYTISFYACLPTVSFKDFCYPSLKYIYVYPHTMILSQKKFTNSIASDETVLISGEAVGETVIIAWDELKKEIKSHKRNVAIHEFAHELDFEEGNINGIPPLEKSQFKEWTKIMYSEYKKFKTKTTLNRFLGKYSLIDRYAATNPAEFFAVLSEYYFTQPQILKKHFPDIYNELKRFYKVETNVC